MKPLKNLPKAEELVKALQDQAENGTQSSENALDMLLDGILPDNAILIWPEELK